MVAERERSGESGGTNDASLRVTRSDARLRERGGGDLRINRLMNESRVSLKIEIASKRLAICYGHLTMARILPLHESVLKRIHVIAIGLRQNFFRPSSVWARAASGDVR